MPTESTVADALTACLTEERKTPQTVGEVVQVYGGSNSVLARDLVGLPESGTLPRKGTAPRRSYDSAMRRVQRYRAPEGKQRRKPSATALNTLIRKGRARLASHRVATARVNGLRLTIVGDIRVSDSYRSNVRMPARGTTWLRPQYVRTALALWQDNKEAEAGEELQALFFSANGYWSAGTATPNFVAVESATLEIG